MEPEVVTRQQLWGEFEDKEAEASNTSLMPSTPPADQRPSKHKMIPKTGSVEGAPEGVEASEVSGEQPSKHPQAKPVSPRVDVSGKEPPTLITEKSAQRYALPSARRYPLDAYSDVVKAASYFDEFHKRFTPDQRHEFGVNLVKRASELGLPAGNAALRYGSEKYASVGELAMAFDCRRSVICDPEHLQVLEELSKTAGSVPPSLFAATLNEFDQMAGIQHLYDGEVPDPFASTFGTVKQAADEQADVDGSTVIGNDVIYHKSLHYLAKTDCTPLKEIYGDDFVKDFRKDPVGIFRSLPADQKKVIGRMADEPSETTAG